MVEQLQKAEKENNGLTKDTILWEEGTKTIEDLKGQVVFMEKENIKLYNEKTCFKENSHKAFQNRKDLKVVF